EVELGDVRRRRGNDVAHAKARAFDRARRVAEGERGREGHEKDESGSRHVYLNCVALRIISSAAVITLVLISYARWAAMRPIISSTTSTLACSIEPCRSVPRPSVPGLPICGSPLAGVEPKRLCPDAVSPAGFTNDAIE